MHGLPGLMIKNGLHIIIIFIIIIAVDRKVRNQLKIFCNVNYLLLCLFFSRVYFLNIDIIFIIIIIIIKNINNIIVIVIIINNLINTKV